MTAWWALAVLLGCSSSHSSGATASGGVFGNAGHGGAQSTSRAGSGAVKGATGTGNGTYQECSSPGSTRSCCGTGTETCSGAVEFASWGPCLDKTGLVLQCGSDTCASNEFGHCDGGTTTPPLDAGDRCGTGEFGAFCGSDGSVPPPPSLCSDRKINNEPEILAAYSPGSGQSVSQDGQIKVWITDEAPAIIGPNEQVDPATGMIVTPGDRTATAPDGYLWEPALYIAPQTAESGGTPHFPQYIRGWYNNTLPAAGMRMPMKGSGIEGPAIESPPAGTRLSEKFNTEDIWDVRDLGLAPGTYSGEFVIHDGDTDRGVGCVTIVITP